MKLLLFILVVGVGAALVWYFSPNGPQAKAQAQSLAEINQLGQLQLSQQQAEIQAAQVAPPANTTTSQQKITTQTVVNALPISQLAKAFGVKIF